MHFRATEFCVWVTSALALLGTCIGEVRADPEQVASGLELAERLCARCHAVTAAGDSPFQPAPPFRELARKWPDTQVLAEALAEGISVGHPAMPEFVLEPGEIGNLLSYMETLKD